MAGVIHRESKGLHGKFGSYFELIHYFFFWFRSANDRQKALKAHKTTIVSSAYTALVSAIKIIQVSFCRDKLKVFLFFQIMFPSKR